MSYTHLTREERYQIRAMLDANCTIRCIASVLGRSPGTVSRELARNSGLRGYRPGQADRFASERAAASRCRHRITKRQWTEISRLIRLDWSPEQITAWAALEGTLDISPEWIYQFIYADKAVGGDLWRHLRCQRKRRKRYGSGRDRRGRIPDRVGIEARPADVETRETMRNVSTFSQHIGAFCYVTTSGSSLLTGVGEIWNASGLWSNSAAV
ncbi:IS30 family transposase [Wenzhouxiangella sp. EGI_FJ10305]|uniref:IS30 family transposase n=1 Tax=Wenzhouxiangella sp. EGI_FJ10305 TaxID=3243768 RepID=UPI0035DEF51A